MLERRSDHMNHNFSYQDFVEFRRSARGFTDLIAYAQMRPTVGRQDGAEVVEGELVSGSFFPTLGVRVAIGRGLSSADDQPDAPPAVVISEALWRRIGGAADSLDGRTIVLDGQPFTIAGVAASPFRGMEVGRDVRVWAPLRYQRILMPVNGGVDLLSRPTGSWLTIMGRLADGVTAPMGVDELNRLEAGLPKTANRPRTRVFALEPGGQGDSMLPSATRQPLTLLLAAALLVLVVACANVAGLLLARASERERELAVRTALGATRGRLSRLLLAEALVLGAGSTAIALGVSIFAARLAVPLLARYGAPVTLDVGLDWRVIVFASAIGLGATTGFGLVPVAAALRRSLAPALTDGGRAASTGRRRALARRGLVVVQFALSLALVVVATLLARTLYNLRTAPVGFDLEHLAILQVDPAGAGYKGARMAQYLDEATARLAAVPGVRAVGYASVVPLDFGGWRSTIAIPGYQPAPNEDLEINLNLVSPRYFDAMGIRALDGHVFDGHEQAGAPLEAVVNESMARRYWKDTRAVGRQFVFAPDRPITVVGVVPDVKYRMLREEAGPSFYLAAAQDAPSAGAFHVRTVDAPERVLELLRRTLAETDFTVPITRARSLREQAALNVNDERLAMTIALALAGAAVLLAAVGLFGAMSYAVGQRTREIGVRMALGAAPGDVGRLVIRQGLALAIGGSAAGIALGWILARSIESRLFGVEPADVTSLVVAVVTLAGVGLIASWWPARRAARVDPVIALRAE
jgi:predicted permease